MCIDCSFTLRLKKNHYLKCLCDFRYIGLILVVKMN